MTTGQGKEFGAGTSWLGELAAIRKSLFRPWGDPGIGIAIIDGMADLEHPVFGGGSLRAVKGPATSEVHSNPAADHGTHIASIIFGGSESVVPGLVPHCRGIIVPIFEGDGHLGVKPCSQEDMAVAIRRALKEEVHIINISAGEFSPGVPPHPLLAEVLAECAERGVVVVAAAGNDACACPHVPASAKTVLVVGAMDDDGKPLPQSNWGPAYRKHGLLAPGFKIPGARPQGGFSEQSGTSVATAFMSGIIALFLSERLARGRPLNSEHLVRNMFSTADPCEDSTSVDCERMLGGRLNLQRLWEWEEKTMQAENNLLPKHEVAVDGNRAVEPESRPEFSGGATASLPMSAEQGMRPMSAGPGSDIHPSMCKECTDELSQAKPAVSSPSRPSLVYALGRVGYEFASDARREGFVQMGLKNPSDAASVLGYLDKFPYAAPDIHWTLSLGSAPIYVLQPYGAYGAEGYQRLRSYLKSQLEGKSDRVSVAGTMGGNVTLNSGQKVPLLYFDLRGFFSWSVDELLPTLAEELGAEGEGAESWQDELKNLLDRLYYELRNTGVSAADRAINYGATNAYIFYKPIRDALRESLSLRRIAVEASPFSPPGAEAYDVILEFFNPLKVHEEAGLVYRFTVDVSDVMPRLLDEPRSWRVKG